MKLLLTSAGLTTDLLARELTALVGKSAQEISVLFVPTAANPILEDKGWLIDNLVEFQKQDFKQIDVLDIAGLSAKEWRPHFEAADVLCFGGGNEQYLAKAMRENGVADALPEFLKTKAYMGISAGSMVMGQFLSHELMNVVYPEEQFEELSPSLGYVDCLFIPHLNSDYFTQVRKEILQNLAPFQYPLYACDDHSALRVVDGEIRPVGEETLSYPR